jgi:hypothetical protein
LLREVEAHGTLNDLTTQTEANQIVRNAFGAVRRCRRAEADLLSAAARIHSAMLKMKPSLSPHLTIRGNASLMLREIKAAPLDIDGNPSAFAKARRMLANCKIRWRRIIGVP